MADIAGFISSAPICRDTVSITTTRRSPPSSSQGKKTARDVAIGGAIGAAVGAIAGGGKGAAIGAGVGAGSGVAIAVITKGEQVQVPSESRLEFRLEQPLQINVQKR